MTLFHKLYIEPNEYNSIFHVAQTKNFEQNSGSTKNWVGKFPPCPPSSYAFVRCVGSNLDMGGQIVNTKSLTTNYVIFYTLGLPNIGRATLGPPSFSLRKSS